MLETIQKIRYCQLRADFPKFVKEPLTKEHASDLKRGYHSLLRSSILHCTAFLYSNCFIHCLLLIVLLPLPLLKTVLLLPAVSGQINRPLFDTRTSAPIPKIKSPIQKTNLFSKSNFSSTLFIRILVLLPQFLVLLLEEHVRYLLLE